MIRLSMDSKEPIAVPMEFARCPYCGGRLICQPTAWEEKSSYSELFTASEVGMTCEDEEELEHLHDFSMPYVDWFPVEMRVAEWLNLHYEWIDDSPASNIELASIVRRKDDLLRRILNWWLSENVRDPDIQSVFPEDEIRFELRENNGVDI